MKRSTKSTKSRTTKRPPAHETHVGNLLRAEREKRGLTLLDVEAKTGLFGGGISFIENGRSVPDLLTAYILCEFYGLSLDKLVAAFIKDHGVPVSRGRKPR
jgi:transcriptional regulator with XRE-family HTH domain